MPTVSGPTGARCVLRSFSVQEGLGGLNVKRVLRLNTNPNLAPTLPTDSASIVLRVVLDFTQAPPATAPWIQCVVPVPRRVCSRSMRRAPVLRAPIESVKVAQQTVFVMVYRALRVPLHVWLGHTKQLRAPTPPTAPAVDVALVSSVPVGRLALPALLPVARVNTSRLPARLRRIEFAMHVLSIVFVMDSSSPHALGLVLPGPMRPQRALVQRTVCVVLVALTSTALATHRALLALRLAPRVNMRPVLVPLLRTVSVLRAPQTIIAMH